jgi:hypothetical protein
VPHEAVKKHSKRPIAATTTKSSSQYGVGLANIDRKPNFYHNFSARRSVP